jgi:hypothetical protein
LGEAADAYAEQALRHGNRRATDTALNKAEQVLASLDLMDLAVESHLLPAAFGQRLEQFASALQHAIKGHSRQALLTALTTLQRHQLADVRKDQVRRAELAVRACGWLHAHATAQDSAAAVIRAYVTEGGFLDWARSHLWSGDEHEAVSLVYQQLTEQVTTCREALNQQFANYLPAIARGDQLGEGIWPVEAALEGLIAPLAKQQRVLLLVLDGMSQGVYRELAMDLMANHWVELQRDGNPGPECLLAALPSITRISRYSLLAGVLGEGASADEKKAFAAHPGLKKVVSPQFSPLLFHKAELQQMGSGALASGVREVIAGHKYRIIGAVINAIDDQLSSNAQLSVQWRVESISLLRQLLEAARESGRLVILTSDHGHVLDHAMEYRKSPGEGERFKAASADAAVGEILVAGERVVLANKKAVLPWSEKIRYGVKKMGYHGGGSLQEVVIPFGVFRNVGDTAEIAGWHEVPRQEPAWWQQDMAATDTPEAAPLPMPSKKKKAKQDVYTQDLFEQLAKTPATMASGTKWIDALLTSPVFLQMKSRTGRVVITDAQLRTLLQCLTARGGQQTMAAVIQALGLPAIRANGFLAGAQKLLNVDGYPVLSMDRTTNTVKLNIESLKTQFEL